METKQEEFKRKLAEHKAISEMTELKVNSKNQHHNKTGYPVFSNELTIQGGNSRFYELLPIVLNENAELILEKVKEKSLADLRTIKANARANAEKFLKDTEK